MDYSKYNRALLDILQVLSKNPELKNVPDLEDWVEMGEMTYRSSPATNMIYKKSGSRLASYSARIFQRDMTLLTGKDAEWPEMFSQFIPKVANMPQADRDYIWTKLADALTAIGHQPQPAVPAATPVPAILAIENKATASPVAPLPAIPVIEKKADAQKKNKTEAAATVPATEEERRHLQFKQVMRENPELRSTVRAVRDYVKTKGGKSEPGPEFEALMAQLKTGTTSVESELNKAGLPTGFLQRNTGIFSKLTGLLQKMADSEGTDPADDKDADDLDDAAAKTPVQEKEDEETRKIMQSLSMVQQFHVTFLKYYMAFAEFRGGQFPQLVATYNVLRSYLTSITKTTPDEYTLLADVAKFFKDNKRAVRKHDSTLFEKPTHPLLVQLEAPKIWASLDKAEYKVQFWNWVEEVRNISLAADICTGKTAPFETIAKSVLPAICSSLRNGPQSADAAEGMMDRFMEAMQQPARIRGLKGLIDNFSKDPSQVTKAVDLITTMLDDGDDDSPSESDQPAASATAPAQKLDISIG